MYTPLVAIALLATLQPNDGRLQWQDLRRVEQGVADQSPLDAAARVAPYEMRQPNDFSGVYSVPKDGTSRYGGWFARVGGGVIAVFPRSVYEQSRQGRVPLIPPNTTFMIGGIPRELPITTPISALALPSRIDTRPPAIDAPTANQPQTARPLIDPRHLWAESTARYFTDDARRAARLADLLAAARRAELEPR